MNKIIILILLLDFSIGCTAQNKSGLLSAIEGEWLVQLNSKDIGLARTVFTFETKGNTFEAYTRKGAANDILGFWKSTLAKIFTDDFKNGSLLRIVDGIIEQRADTLFLKGIFTSAAGNYYFNGKIVNDSLSAKLTNTKAENRGIISGEKTNVNIPLANYPKIVNEAIETTKDKIFDPSIMKTEDWNDFEENIKEVAREVRDDIEMVFAWFYFGNKLPISHFALVKIEPTENKKQVEKEKADKNQVILKEKSENTAYLKIKSFGGTAKEMDSVFSIIKSRNYKNLIVDLRNNQGGTVEAGMSFAENVVDTTLIGGIFLTQIWFSNHDSVPTRDQYDQFPYFTKANYDLIIEGIHNEKGLVLKVIPNQTTFQGDLYILTNNSTASTCEPIVYSLKNKNRAVVIGERTAGAMLNGEIFEISGGFSLIVPTADYYTSDGYRIDQHGIPPTIKVESENALKYTMKNIIANPINHNP